nr:hypothetical protein [Tanacetum cinerariifolium]
MNQNFCNSNCLGFDQLQPLQSPVIHQPPQEMSIQEMKDLKQQYLDEMKCLSNSKYRDEWAYLSTHPLKRLNSFCYDDDEDYIIAVTHVLSTEEPDNSLSIGDEHLDTIPATESDEVIKSSVENLIPISSESEGIPEHMCDVPFHDNIPPLDVLKDQFKDFFESNDEFSSTNDDSFSIEKIDYVEASPPDSELVSSEVMEIVIPKVGGIDDDILLTIKDDILRENLLIVNHLFAKIEALNDSPIPLYDPIVSGTPPTLTPSGESDFFLEETKSSSTSLNSLLEETNTFDNSLPESNTFCFDVEEISSGSTTTRSDISLPEYEASYDNQSCSDEDVPEKLFSTLLFDEEIIPMKMDQHYYNAESDLMKSLRTHDSSLLISSKIDSLLDEFAGELTILKSIPPGIDETDCDPEEDIRLIEILLYDNSSPRLPKEFVSANSDAEIESFSPSPILVKDSDSLMEEIIYPDLPINDTLLFPEKESFYFDIPSFSRPPAKPPDVVTEILNIKMMGDISDQKVPMPKLMITLASHQKKSPDLLSHRGLKAFQPFATCPMMIHGKNIPILDVMAIFVISILSESLEESVGTFTAQVILFGMIPTAILATIPDMSLVEARSSPPSLPTHDSPPTLRQILPAPPGLPRRPAILVLPGQPIPIGRPYHTQPNVVRKMLTGRKSVGPLPIHRLASRYQSDSSSLRHSSSARSVSKRPSHLSSAGPSRKRCRSLSDSVSSATPVPGDLSHVRTNLLPPCKKVRSFVSATDCEASSKESYEPYTGPNIDSDIQADIDASIVAADAIAARETDVRVETEDEAEEKAESSARGTVKITVDRVTHLVLLDDLVEPVREDFLSWIVTLERDNMRLRGMLGVERQRVDRFRRSMSYAQWDLRQIRQFCFHDHVRIRRLETYARIMTITRSGMTPKAIKELISRCVEEVLAAQEANCNARLIDENQSQNGDDNDNGSKGNGIHGNNNGNGNQNGGDGCAKINSLVDKVCTYKDFLNCQPHNFNGTEGVIDLARWFEKTESVFRVSNCSPNSQVKFATCTLLDGALTWWNSHVQTFGIDKAYKMLWKDLIKLMIEVHRGLPDNIQGNVTSSKPDRLQDAIRMANGLMDRKVRVYVVRNAKQNRKFKKPPFKRHNVAQVVMLGNSEKKGYARSASYYNKCRLHHEGPCTVKCNSYKKVRHMARDYKIFVAAQTPRSPNRRNKAANNDAHGRAYALGGGDGNPDSNVVTGTFLLNNHYAYILFDSGGDRSFVQTTFSALIDIPHTALDVSYTIDAVVVGLLHKVLQLPRHST